MQDRYFSDEELVAFLDGEDDFAPTEEITYALKHNADLARRLDALRVDTNLIAEGFKELAVGDRPRPALTSTPAMSRPYRQIAAAAAVALLVGFGAGYSTSTPDQPGWKAYVAAYQALYTNATLAHVAQSETRKRSELKRVAASIGKDIDLTKLSISPEVDYKRAQTLSFKGKALVQLAFLSSTGEPMALCIIRSKNNKKADVSVGELEGLSTATWARDGYDYLLIGGTDQPLVSRLATKFNEVSL